MKAKRILAFGMAVLMTGGLLAGCGSKEEGAQTSTAGESDNVSLKVWADQDILEATKQMVENFIAEHPDKNYDIEVVLGDSGKAEEEVKKDPEAAADIIALPHDQLGQMVESGVLYENTKYVDRIKEENTETAYEAATYQGAVYGYPYAVESMFLVYNKSMLSDEDVKSFEAITAKAPIGFNVAEEGTNYTIAPQYIANGCKLYGDSGENLEDITFNSEQGVNVTKWIASLKNNPNMTACNSESVSLLKEGKIAAMVTGPWGKNDIMDALGDNLGVAVYPTCDFGDGSVQMKAFQGVKLLAVNAATQYPLDAMELADYLTSAECQKMRFEAAGAVPCNKELRDTDEIKNDPITNVVSQMTEEEYTVLMPKLPELRSFWDLLDPIIIDAYSGNLTEADMQTKLDDMVADSTTATE